MIIQLIYSTSNKIFTLTVHQEMTFGILCLKTCLTDIFNCICLSPKSSTIHAPRQKCCLGADFCVSEVSGTVYPSDKVLLNPICALTADMADRNWVCNLVIRPTAYLLSYFVMSVDGAEPVLTLISSPPDCRLPYKGKVKRY